MEITRIEQKTLGRIAIIKVVWHDQVTAFEQQLPRLVGLLIKADRMKRDGFSFAIFGR
jgi:hypothetical protein